MELLRSDLDADFNRVGARTTNVGIGDAWWCAVRSSPTRFIVVVFLAVFGVASTTWSQPQSQAETAPVEKHKYEVASIRKHLPNGSQLHSFTSDGLAITGPLHLFIRVAYEVFDFQISGEPNWVGSELFDIQAKMDKSLANELGKLSQDDRSRERDRMFQMLLADRFKLKVHRETKEQTVYTLVVAKNGPKIHPSIPQENENNPNGRATAPGTYQSIGEFSGVAVPIGGRGLVWLLSQTLGQPVLDKTGLTGNYDFTLKWNPDQKQTPMLNEKEGNQSPANNITSMDSSGPSIFTALQEQLGLKLQAQKGSVEILVIDHVEKPSEN
jgi:uncharacterized protein (TIGR03435 family)